MKPLHRLVTAALLVTIPACGGGAQTGSTTPTAASSHAGAKKGIPADKQHAIPSDWQEVADAAKGYSFHVPAGTSGTTKAVSGVDFYFAQTPQPHNIEVMVAAFKNKSLSKDDLIKEATEVLTALGNTQITTGTVTEVSSDYNLVDMTMVDESAVHYKTLVLVATDVTDNYIMIIGTPETEFGKNKDTLEAMWSSFQMWSGGASGES